jgi:hypothetical protein
LIFLAAKKAFSENKKAPLKAIFFALKGASTIIIKV